MGWIAATSAAESPSFVMGGERLSAATWRAGVMLFVAFESCYL